MEANPDDVSVTLPGAFGEIMLRVYTREPRFFGLVQLGFREVLRGFTIPPAPPSRAATEELEDAGIDIPLDLGPDPMDMLTPPAESPSASAPAASLGTRLGKKQLSRAASANVAGLGAPKAKGRVATGRSKSAMLDRTSSGRVTDVGENVFTKVPPTYGSMSPTRRAKGQKREREREEARLRTEEASTSGVGGVGGEAGGSAKELELDLELELELEGEVEVAGGSRGIRGRKRSKV